MTARTAPYPCLDVDDLEDGDLVARIAEIGMPPGPVWPRVPSPPAARTAEVDALVTAWAVAHDRGAAVRAHVPGPSAADLLA